MTSAASYEKLGAFYLGRSVDAQSGEVTTEPLLYDSKDLTTHALCVGMTGSGKTGLCVSLLEEALIDDVPVIAIDPKGDLSNLLLTFPDLAPGDFEPFLDAQQAQRKGLTRAQLARKTAALWKKGLADWGQEPERIAKLKTAAETVVYTPGSEAVRPLSVLRALDRPSDAVMADPEALRDRIATTVQSLLSLAGVDADPLVSREHVFLSHVLERAFLEGRDMDLASLVLSLQKPGFDRIGVLDLETFFPAKDRLGLMLRLNGLLASPRFAAWLAGEPLDIDRLLRSPSGKPRVSILSIAHLSDSERMFFVSVLLGEIVAWMRAQSGTPSLRAILYMDEVFGFLPPVKEPPSKAPMLTLLKQARAFGLGVVLATQNPVDVDYKALSNCGTWFLGRLQTARDKARVLDGLEGATQAAGQTFDRERCDALLSGLSSRQFLMNNVHDDGPALMHTRWALSYLCGPLTLTQLAAMAGSTPATTKPHVTAAATETEADVAAAQPQSPPTDMPVSFAVPLPASGPLVYLPALYGEAQLHYVDGRKGIDCFEDVAVVCALGRATSISWSDAAVLPASGLDLASEPETDASFEPLPSAPLRAKALKTAERGLKDHLYRNRPLAVARCRSLKLVADPEETTAAFTARVEQAAREQRDLDAEKLKAKFGPKVERMKERLRKAEAKVDAQKAQVSQQTLSTAISVGGSLLGAFFGRRSTRGVTQAVRGAGRIARERGDVERAEEDQAAVERQLSELEAELQEALAELGDTPIHARHPVEELLVRPRKGDLEVRGLSLVWLPHRRTPKGLLPAWAQD